MTLEQFYGIIRDAVRYYPEMTETYERLQSFAALQDLSDLNADNLGHSILSKDTNYFFSRRWESLNHPANNIVYLPPLVYALPLSLQLSDPFKTTSYQNVLIEIGALYPNIEKMESGLSALCKRINQKHIYDLSSSWLDYIFHYLMNAVFASTDVEPTEAWYNKDQLDQYVTDAEISSYSINPAKTNKFHQVLKAANPSISGDFLDNFGNDNYCGTYYRLTVPVQYCADSYTYRFKNDCC